MEEQSSEGQSSEGERQSGDEQLARDAEQRQAGPTGPGTHIIENELAEGQLGMPQLFRGSDRTFQAYLNFLRQKCSPKCYSAPSAREGIFYASSLMSLISSLSS